jgi:thymidylate kinase
MNPKVLKSVPAYITFALARKADKCVFLDVDPRIAYERKKDIISMGELKYKQTFYRYIAKVMGFSIIDTSNYKVENVVNNILELCQDLHL